MSGPWVQVGVIFANIALSVVSAIFRPRQDRRGQRLSDEQRRITTSAYGETLPLIFGRMRVGGNVIWGRDFDEVVRTTSAGKGGGGTVTEYFYFADLAVGICEGPIESVDRIYADKQVIYDAISDDPEPPHMEGLQFRVYQGTEDQEPDPLIQQHVDAEFGPGSTPAYRGTAYVVFEQFPVTPFGNRLPQFEFVVTRRAAEGTRVAVATDDSLGSITRKTRVVYDRDRNLIYAITGDGDVATEHLIVSDARTGEIVASRPLQAIADDVDYTGGGEVGDPSIASAGIAGASGPWLVLQIGGVSARPKICVDKRTLAGRSKIGTSVGGSTNVSETVFPTTYPMTVVPITSLTGHTFHTVFGGWEQSFAFGTQRPLWALGIGDDGRLSYKWGKDFVAAGWSPKGIQAGPQTPTATGAERDVFWAMRNVSFESSGTLQIWRSRLLVTTDVFGSVVLHNDPVHIWTAPVTSTGAHLAMAWSDTANALIVSDGNATYAITRTGTQLWSASYGTVTPYPDQFDTTIASGGVFAALGSNTGVDRHLNLLDVLTGEVVDEFRWDGSFTGYPDGPNGDVALYDPQFNRAVVSDIDTATLVTVYGRRSDADPEPLADVVEEIATRSRRLDPADLDVTGLSGTVAGYSIRSGSLRDMLEPLAAAYNFDIAEIDGQLAGVHRDGIADVTVADADLVDRPGEDGEPIDQSRGLDIEAPLSVTVSYVSADLDWQVSSQTVSRAGAAVSSTSQAQVDFSLSLTDDEGIATAQRLLLAAWMERETTRFTLNPAYLGVVPTDVVELGALGREACWRVDRVAVGANHVVEIEGNRTADYLYPVTVTSVVPDGVVPGAVPARAALVFPILMDMPFLRDTDAQATGLGLIYTAMAREAGQANAYRASRLVVSADSGESWAVKASHRVEATWGVFEDALPPIPTGYNATQEVTVRVRILHGAAQIASVTAEQMIGTLANACAVVGSDGSVEIGHFRDAVDTGDGVTFEMTGWLRGRRGTEVFSGGRRTGDLFVLLEDETLEAFTVPSGAIGRTDQAAAVNNRQDHDDFRQTYVNALRALMPWAPVHVSAAADGGDIDLTWVRRTRLGGNWMDGTGTVPLSEGSEAYRVEIFDTDGETLLRTYQSTTPAVTYPAADVTADFGSVPASLHVRVRQLSETVGPGFGEIIEIEVAA